jgi:hypothetical protein
MGKKHKIKVQKSIYKAHLFPEIQFFEKAAALSVNPDLFYSWGRSFDEMVFSNHNQKDALVIKADSLTYQTIDLKKERETAIAGYIQEISSILSEPKHVTRLSTRTFFTVETGIHVDQLNQILCLKMANRELLETFGTEASNLSMVYVFQRDSYLCRIEVLNVSRDGLVEQVGISANEFFKKGHEGGKAYLAHFDEIPEFSTLIDIDVSPTESIEKFEDIGQFFSKTRELKHDLVREMSDYLFKNKL